MNMNIVIRIFFLYPYYTFFWNENTGDIKITSDSTYTKGNAIKLYLNDSGYLTAKMCNKNVVIHQFLGEKLFGPKKRGYVINHKDCNKTNNSRNNLEYITIRENIHHAILNGNHPSSSPERSGRYKDGRAIKSRIKQYKHEYYERSRTNKA